MADSFVDENTNSFVVYAKWGDSIMLETRGGTHYVEVATDGGKELVVSMSSKELLELAIHIIKEVA